MLVMKAFAVLSLALFGLAHGQVLPKLQPALAVDIRVQTVEWHPHGDALLYSRVQDDGIGIGLYELGDAEGKVVLHLAKDDHWTCEWFGGTDCALLTVNRKVQTGQGPGKEAAVYLLDAKRKTAYEVFARTVLGNEEISIDSDLSPGLTHAIITVSEGKRTYHVVLPINGGLLVASPDIDQAVAQGFSGPTWSANGTAIFGKGDGSNRITFTLGGQKGQGTLTTDDKSNGIVLELTAKAEVQQSLESALSNLVFRIAPPAPPAGSPALEVVPANGVLRQVRSPGPWVDKPVEEGTMESVDSRSEIRFKRMLGSAHSLWLVLGKPSPAQIVGDGNGNVVVERGLSRVVGDGSGGVTAGQRPPRDDAIGILVAAHADSAYIAPQERAIAYIEDGALFVRLIQK